MNIENEFVKTEKKEQIRSGRHLIFGQTKRAETLWARLSDSHFQ